MCNAIKITANISETEKYNAHVDAQLKRINDALENNYTDELAQVI